MINKSESKTPFVQSFFTIPYYISSLPGMTLGYLRVYEVIFSFWYMKLPCYIGVDAICERTDLSRSHVYEAINYFIDNGEIEIKYIKGNRNYVQPIRILGLKEDEQVMSNIPLQRKRCPLQRKKVSATADYSNNQLVNTISNKLYRSSEDDQDRISLMFDQVWKKYPKKVAKHQAFRAWKRHKVYEHYDKIMADIDLRQQNNWSGKEKQFIPNPATYFLGERWNDEITMPEKRTNYDKPSKSEQFTNTLRKNLEKNLRDEHPELFRKSSDNPDSNTNLVDDNPLLSFPGNLGR